MPDKKLTDNLSNNSPILSNGLSDSEIVKEMQGIKESMKRHIDLTNEMGQDLLRIDEEYTGGSKVWLTTDYFKKVVKHFCHSNYLVKCLELVFEYINRLQADLIDKEKKLQKALKSMAVNKRKVIDFEREIDCQKSENERLKEGKSKLENKIDEIYPLVMQLPNAMQQAKAEAYREFAEKAKEIINVIVDLMFDDSVIRCQVPNCHKTSSISCGSEICIQENKAYWHGKLDNLLKEMEGGTSEVED